MHGCLCHASSVNLFASRSVRRGLLFLLLPALVCAIFLLPGYQAGPVCRGRHLSEWIALRQTYEGKEPATSAIREIGTNAIPSLLDWIAYEPPYFSYHLKPGYEALPKFLTHTRPVQTLLFNTKASDRAQDAMDAFSALGPLALPAIPELIRRINNTNTTPTRIRATIALAHIGDAAVPTMISMLTSPEGAADLWLMQWIGMLGTNARPLVPALVRNLDQTNELAALLNARMLGELKHDPDLVVPALMKSLGDSRHNLRLEAARLLPDFGAAAQPALPLLTNALSDSDRDVRYSAGLAIERIALQIVPINPTH
jgi:hypothetical protein